MLPDAMTSLVYVGAYTGAGKAEGIGVFRLDPQSGALDPLQTVGGLNSPTFLALHPTRPLLYSVERQVDEPGLQTGAVTGFAVDPAGGRLTRLNRQPSGGASPCYVSVHPSGRYVFAANYASGHVASYAVAADGSVGPPISVVHHQGSGPNPQRQEGPHAHSIVPDPGGTFVLSCDLGIDRVLIYRLSAEGALLPNDPPAGVANGGSGPRHLAFHPSRRFVYVVNEIDSTVTAYAYDGGAGRWTRSRPSPPCPPATPGRPTPPRSSSTPAGASSTPPTGGTTASPSSPSTRPAACSAPGARRPPGGARRATSTSTPAGACCSPPTRTGTPSCPSASTPRAGR